MKKFVIEYTTGEYDSYIEHIYTMEAESKTDIQLWILAAIEQWKLVWAEHTSLFNDPSKTNDILAWHEKYQKFLSENSIWSLQVNDYKICRPDDMNQDFDHLTITELDEWFENTKPEKVNKNES